MRAQAEVKSFHSQDAVGTTGSVGASKLGGRCRLGVGWLLLPLPPALAALCATAAPLERSGSNPSSAMYTSKLTAETVKPRAGSPSAAARAEGLPARACVLGPVTMHSAAHKPPMVLLVGEGLLHFMYDKLLPSALERA